MTFQKFLVLLAAGVGAMFIAFVAPGIREEQQLIRPTPNSVSTFFKSYNPEPVIARFRDNESRWSSESKGASAGRLFITNQHDCSLGFAIESVKQTALMQALRDDLYAQLSRDGALIIDRYSDHGDPQGGFGFGYRIGNSVGQVTVFPIAPRPWVPATPLTDNISEVTVNIAASEKWFPHEFEAIQAGREIASQRPPQYREPHLNTTSMIRTSG